MPRPTTPVNAQFDQERLLARLEQVQSQVTAMHEEVERLRDMAAIGELAAMIAHEVRNIMTPVIAAAQRAKSDSADRGKVMAALDRAAIGGLQAVGVCDAILDLAVSAGAEAPNAASARVDHAVRDAVGSLDAAGQRLELELTGDRSVSVALDQRSMVQVLSNLFSNALAAKPDGNVRVEVRTRVHGPGSTWNRPNVTIEVQDDGPGIEPGARPTLFKAFSQSGGSGGRAGLGLSICRRLLARVGGTINLVDTDTSGACFRITLPAASDADEDAQSRVA